MSDMLWIKAKLEYEEEDNDEVGEFRTALFTEPLTAETYTHFDTGSIAWANKKHSSCSAT